MAQFSVSYAIWSEADVEAGETRNTGWISEGESLRDAIDQLKATESNRTDWQEITASSSNLSDRLLWFRASNSADWETGEREERSLHIPETVTLASRKRIARLLGVKTN